MQFVIIVANTIGMWAVNVRLSMFYRSQYSQVVNDELLLFQEKEGLQYCTAVLGEWLAICVARCKMAETMLSSESERE